jgi:hypothetical protein
MTNEVRILRSVTTNTPGALEQGELAHSEEGTPDGLSKLWIGVASSGIQQIGGKEIVDIAQGLTITGALTGDVTTSANVATIADEAVSNAKLAHMAEWTLKLRNSAGTGDPVDIKITALADEPAPSAGDYMIIELADGTLARADIGDITGSGTDVQVDTGGSLGNADFQDGGDINFAESAGVITATISPDKVTYDIMQDIVANNSFLGNDNGGTQTVQELSKAEALVILNVADGANVNDADTTLNTDTDVSGNTWVLDEDDLSTNSATKLATQQSIKAYVDSVAQGLDPTDSCVASTTADLPASTYANGTAGVGATLTGDGNGALAAQDGVTLVVNERLLVKDQTAGLENGIYELTQVGDGSNPFILTRTTDADEADEQLGQFTFVEEGTLNADNGYVMTTNGPITMGTTALVYAQFSGAGQIIAGAALSKDGNTLDVEVDDTGIEVNTDQLRLKDSGVTLAKQADVVTDSFQGRFTAATGIQETVVAASLTEEALPEAADFLIGFRADGKLVRYDIGNVSIDAGTF